MDDDQHPHQQQLPERGHAGNRQRADSGCQPGGKHAHKLLPERVQSKDPPLNSENTELTTPPANPRRGTETRHHAKQLHPHPDDEREMGFGRPERGADGHLLRGVRRPPVPEVGHERARVQGQLPEHVVQRRPRRQHADDRGRVLAQPAGQRAVDVGLGPQLEQGLLPEVVRGAGDVVREAERLDLLVVEDGPGRLPVVIQA